MSGMAEAPSISLQANEKRIARSEELKPRLGERVRVTVYNVRLTATLHDLARSLGSPRSAAEGQAGAHGTTRTIFMTRYGRMTRLFAAAGMVALVAACDENRRGVDAPPPASLAELEGVSELPYAEPARVQSYAPDQAYPYAERAYGLQRAFLSDQQQQRS